MFDIRGNISTYSNGVLSVLSGEMQGRQHEKTRRHTVTGVHPNYCRSAPYEKPKLTRAIIRGAFVLRAISECRSPLSGHELEQLPYSDKEVDQLVDAGGKPVTFDKLRFFRTLDNLFSSRLVHHALSAEVCIDLKASAVISRVPDQALTVYPDTGVIHPSTTSKAQRINEIYEQSRDGDPSLL